MSTKLRSAIIEMGKRLVAQGLVAGTGGNISARLPESNRILITPSGMEYGLLQPEDLVELDLDGNITGGNRKPSIERTLHLLIYRHRPEVNAVVHTHSLYACSVATTRQSIPTILDSMVGVIGGSVDVAEYAPHGSEQLAQNCSIALGRKNAALLANHGVVGVGLDLAQAYLACLISEQAAQVYLFSHLIGKPHVLPVEVVEYEKEFMRTQYGQKA